MLDIVRYYSGLKSLERRFGLSSVSWPKLFNLVKRETMFDSPPGRVGNVFVCFHIVGHKVFVMSQIEVTRSFHNYTL